MRVIQSLTLTMPHTGPGSQCRTTQARLRTASAPGGLSKRHLGICNKSKCRIVPEGEEILSPGALMEEWVALSSLGPLPSWTNY